MKSHFSRFLHITSSYSGLTRISRSNKFANCLDLDTPIKSECDTVETNAATCHGRSMVEMLGVLAIIGVLSVGAIAGYSKAMFKYRLNKHAESFSMFLNEAIKLLPDLQRHYGKNITTNNGLTLFFDKANLLPDGMKFKNNVITDIFNNQMTISYANSQRNDGSSATEYYIHIRMNRSGGKLSEQDKEICRNIVIATKENYENLWQIEMRSGRDSSYTSKALRGALSPYQTNPLSKASITQIDDMCDSCNSETYCSMYIFINSINNP